MIAVRVGSWHSRSIYRWPSFMLISENLRAMMMETMTAKLPAQLPEISSNLLGGRCPRATHDLMERHRASHDEARELA